MYGSSLDGSSSIHVIGFTFGQMMLVEITGPRAAVEKVLEEQTVPAARRRDCHSVVWIQAPDITLEVQHLLQREGLKVHHVERRA